MIGFLVFVMGFSALWIMWRFYTDVVHLQACIDRVCKEMDDLRVELLEKEQNGEK